MTFDGTNWNYRIVRTVTSAGDGKWDISYAIHEVYYTKNGKPTACTVEASYPYGECLTEFTKDLGQYMTAFTKPVLNMEDIPELVSPDAS